MDRLSPATNEHISPEFVTRGLAPLLAEIEDTLEEPVHLSWLGRQKKGADNTTRLLVNSRSGTPHAVIVFSRPAAPELVARAGAVAESIRDLVGEALGCVIPKPLFTGHHEGRSYMVLPCYRELSGNRFVGVLQRRRLRRPVMNWLQEACGNATQAMRDLPAAEGFAVRLEYLRDQHFLNREPRAAIDGLLARLKAGEWHPRHTFDHNDMWIGNIMLPGTTPLGGLIESPFVLIDWAGANPHGYGVYDVVRMGMAFGLAPARLRRELQAHCAHLACEPQDARGHLLASLARLHEHLEHFPEERYIATFNRCWHTINEALGDG